jgi:hypothetical protein
MSTITATSLKTARDIFEESTTATISEIRRHECGMPIAVLVNENGDEIGFLSPFRGYSFQVSGDFEGHGDMGSSRVIGLANVLTAELPKQIAPSNLYWEETKKELLKGQAMLALYNFGKYAGVTVDTYTSELSGNKVLSDGRKVWCNDALDLFIEEVCIYVASTIR